ncbi:MAG TPA: AraC family transcriptional regulator [Pyrinomonadaceae bacterium]|jgi:AraC-like DNA-binding protein
MAKKQLIADKKGAETRALPNRRKSENLPGGLYYFEDELEIDGVLKACVITSAGWLLEILKLDAGEVSFTVGDEEICPQSSPLAIFYPPFTITRPGFKNVKASLEGIAGTAELPLGAPAQKPCAFEADFAKSPKTVREVVEILQSSRRRALIVGAHPKASLLALKAKKLIDENYQVFPSIACIAARLKVSHEHLTRQFKRDFSLSPSAYLHQIRIADAAFRLTRGEAIIEVSGDVGYNDLSRFYKQFRKTTAKSPGFCKSSGKTVS